MPRVPRESPSHNSRSLSFDDKHSAQNNRVISPFILRLIRLFLTSRYSFYKLTRIPHTIQKQKNFKLVRLRTDALLLYYKIIIRKIAPGCKEKTKKTPQGGFLFQKTGAGGNRTHEYQFCRLTPYHLATAPKYISN